MAAGINAHKQFAIYKLAMDQNHTSGNVNEIESAVKEQTEVLVTHECTDVAVDHQSDPLVPEWFRRYCSALGMSPQAPDAWAIIHINPHIPCLVCLISTLIALVCGTVYIVASEPYRWHYHGVVAMWMLSYFIMFISTWRNGPLPAGNRQLAYMGCSTVMVSTYNLAAMILIFGPDASVLFQNRLALTFFDAATLLFVMVGAFFGGWPPDYPKEPHK